MKSILQVFTLTVAITAPVSALAENITLNFYALGLRAGTITVNGKESQKSYAISGSLTPTRLLRSIKDIGYAGSASGKIKNGTLYSSRYAGNARTGSRNSTVVMHWSGNKPIVDKYQPAREKRNYDIDPAKQIGTKDLLTAAYSTFKTTSADKLCNTVHNMFDGRRRSDLILGKPKISGKIAVCAGTYKRVAGFSPSQMQKKVNFPFSLRYEQMDDGNYRFMEFTANATFGKIRATRK